MKAHENPFRSSAIAKIRYRIDPEVLDTLLRRLLGETGCHGIVGHPGTGKTTLIEDLAVRQRECLPGVPVLRIGLNRESRAGERWGAVRRVGVGARGTLVYFDGAEVLGRLRLLWLARTVARRGMHGLLSLHWRRIGIPVLWETRPDPLLMKRLVGELLGREPDATLRAVAESAYYREGGNLREVFGACYREMARRETGPISS